jgi:hypothetical protein
MNFIDLLVFRRVTSQIKNTSLLPGPGCDVVWSTDSKSVTLSALYSGEPRLWLSKKNKGYVVYIYFSRVILESIGEDLPYILFTMNSQKCSGVVTVQPGEEEGVDYFVYAKQTNSFCLLNSFLLNKIFKSAFEEVEVIRKSLDDIVNSIKDQSSIDKEFDIENEEDRHQ